MLIPLASSMHSCQLQEAINQSIIEQLETTSSTNESLQGFSTNNTNTKSKCKGPFIPIHETAKRKKKVANL